MSGDTGRRTITAYMMSNARGIYPKQCARISTEYLSK